MIALHAMRRRRRLLAAMFCFSCLLWARGAEPPSATTQTAADRFAPIASALQNKEFARALELLGPALQAAPGSAQLWIMQGVAYSGQGRSKDALAAFRKALKIAPNDLRALEGAAQIEYENGTAAAAPLLQHVLRLRPGDPVTHGMLAVVEYRQGNCEVATGHFEKAGKLFDGQVEALHAYATCLVKLKQFDQAAVVFQRAVAAKPDDQRERHLLAAIQLLAQQPQAALVTLGPLLAGEHPHPESLELASAAYESAKQTPQAVATLRQAILLDPKNVNLYLDFANLSFAHESFQVGIDVINDGVELQPQAAPLYFARGVLYVSLAQYDKAEADFQKAYELDPSQSLSAAAQGLAAAQENDLDRALTKVQASLAQKPNDALLLYLQADILSQKGAEPGTPEFETAMRSATKAVSLQPTLGAARGVLAKLDLQAGRNQEAVEQCRKALESDPKDQTVVYHLIQGLRKTGKQDEIPALLKRLARLREQATKKQRERSRYKLVEDDTLPTESAQP